MVNVQTKFEISVCTHYEDMKANTKCRIWGVWGLWVTQNHQQCHHSIKQIWLPIRL